MSVAVLGQNLPALDEVSLPDGDFSDAYLNVQCGGLDFDGALTSETAELSELRELAHSLSSNLKRMKTALKETEFTSPASRLEAVNVLMQANQVSMNASHYLIQSGTLLIKQANRNLQSAVEALEIDLTEEHLENQ